MRERGRAEVTAEADDTNIACMSLLLGLGAWCEGGSVEFIRRTLTLKRYCIAIVIKIILCYY